METLDKKLARGSKGKSRRVKELLPESQLREKVMRLYMTHWRNFLSEMALGELDFHCLGQVDQCLARDDL